MAQFTTLAALCLIASPALGATATTSFADFAGGQFLDHAPASGTIGAYGPFTFNFGAQTVTVTRDPDWPDIWSLGSMCCDPVDGFWAIPNDPAIDPGDFEGRAWSSADDLILNLDPPVRAFGATFKHYTLGSIAQGNRMIIAWDGPDGTGNMIGTVSSQAYQYADFRYYLDFVGIIDETESIRSVTIPGLDTDWTLLDGIAVVPPTVAPACPGDATGDNQVNFDDLNQVLDNWAMTVTPGTNGDLTDDGQVNFDDLNQVLDAWATSCP